MLLSNIAEASLLKIFEKYQSEKKLGKDDIDARVFSYPLPCDAFLDGLLSVDKELENSNMIEIIGMKEFNLTRGGIEYCEKILSSKLTLEAAQKAKKDAFFAKCTSVISILIALAAFIRSFFT